MLCVFMYDDPYFHLFIFIKNRKTAIPITQALTPKPPFLFKSPFFMSDIKGFIVIN